MRIKLSIPIVLFVASFRVCIQKSLYTPILKNQNDKEIDWKNYKYIIVGNRKGDGDTGKIWVDKIENYESLSVICAIATIPRWITRTPGSKYFIKKSIYLLEKNIPIFIDWEEDFSNNNDIHEYPTILIVRVQGETIIELGRIYGSYNKQNWIKFVNLSKKYT